MKAVDTKPQASPVYRRKSAVPAAPKGLLLLIAAVVIQGMVNLHLGARSVLDAGSGSANPLQSLPFLDALARGDFLQTAAISDFILMAAESIVLLASLLLLVLAWRMRRTGRR